MHWFNLYGLIAILIIMIPNIIYAATCKEGFDNLWKNKTVELFEQIGRYGCFILMIFSIPYTYYGFWLEQGLLVYLVVNAVLIALYDGIWAVLFHRNSVFRALALSILPSLIFLFSGIMIFSVPLIVAALIFAPCHILISYRNTTAALAKNQK